MILAIDPGLIESAFCLIAENHPIPFRPALFDKVKNNDIRCLIRTFEDKSWFNEMVVEKPVCSRYSGAEVSGTAVQAGIFIGETNRPAYLITRPKVKGFLLGKVAGKSSDSAIISYLCNRFAAGLSGWGKGTKENPGWFYGFHRDIWQAYALGVAFIDMKKSSSKKDIKYIIDSRVWEV